MRSRWRLLRCARRWTATTTPTSYDDDDELSDDEDDDDGPEVGVTIEIIGLSLYTHHGVSAAEREVGQRLVLDLRFDVGEPDATVTDRVEDTVDYGEVCQVVALSPSSARYKTLERLCAAIADRLLDDYERRERVGQGGQARAADPAAGRGGLGRGLARGALVRGASLTLK